MPTPVVVPTFRSALSQPHASDLPRGCEKPTRRLAEDLSEYALSAFDRASSLVEIETVHLIAPAGQQRDRSAASLTVMTVAMKEKLFGVVLNEPAVLTMRRQRPLAVPVGHDSNRKTTAEQGREVAEHHARLARES